MIEGIDVSNHQGNVAWDTVAASGVRFAIVKASEGKDYVDRYFARNWSEMGRLMLPRGAYHFARPSANDPISEARHFLSVVEPEVIEAGDILALDMEDEHAPVGASLSEWSLTWMDYIVARVGFKPIFYTYNAYIGERRLTDPRLAGYALWLASYQSTVPPCPRPWDAISIWQYTSEQAVPGAGPRIDCNKFFGNDIADLTALGAPGLVAATDDDGPFDTADAAYDAYCLEHGVAIVWSGQIAGRAHWFGSDPQPIARTTDAHILAYQGAFAVDVTASCLDDWQTLTQTQLTIY